MRRVRAPAAELPFAGVIGARLAWRDALNVDADARLVAHQLVALARQAGSAYILLIHGWFTNPELG